MHGCLWARHTPRDVVMGCWATFEDIPAPESSYYDGGYPPLFGFVCTPSLDICVHPLFGYMCAPPVWIYVCTPSLDICVYPLFGYMCAPPVWIYVCTLPHSSCVCIPQRVCVCVCV